MFKCLQYVFKKEIQGTSGCKQLYWLVCIVSNRYRTERTPLSGDKKKWRRNPNISSESVCAVWNSLKRENKIKMKMMKLICIATCDDYSKNANFSWRVNRRFGAQHQTVWRFKSISFRFFYRFSVYNFIKLYKFLEVDLFCALAFV